MTRRLSRDSQAFNAIRWLWGESEDGRESLEWIVERIRDDFDQPHYKNHFLDFAVSARNLDATKAGLSLGADVNANMGGYPILHIAVENGDLEIADFLLSHGPDLTQLGARGLALHIAAADGNDAMVELLLKYGAEVYECDPDGQNAVDIARQSKHVVIEQILLEAAERGR